MEMLAHSEDRHCHLEGDVSTHISCRWLTQPRRYAPAEGQAGVMERELKSNRRDQQLLVNTIEVGNERGVITARFPVPWGCVWCQPQLIPMQWGCVWCQPQLIPVQ